MLPPPKPTNEASRVATLHRLGLLDTEPDLRFQRYVRLAKHAFQVPTALISLVDEDRQWFKAKVGLNACETSRDVSFCGHAILQQEVFVIHDAATDPRFADNPLVTGPPHIRFYAAYPLAIAPGLRIGTLCILDDVPRVFDGGDRHALADLGELLVQELKHCLRADNDPLTGLMAAHIFERTGQALLEHTRRSDGRLSAAVLKIDGLKQANLQHGHAWGDRALIRSSELLRGCFRASDVIARLDGSSFAVLMPGTDLAGAQAMTGRLMAAIAASPDEALLPMSAGLATWDPSRHPNVGALFREAAERLHLARQSMRGAA